MIRVKQAIVVEGKYDKNVLKQLVDAPIFETNGFGVMNDRALLNLLRKVAEKRGLIILTDPDGAGFVIRNYLKGALPRDKVLHAYVPDIYGKERRKMAPGREGKLGVEGMRPEILLQALKDAGAELDGQSLPPREPVTRLDFYACGLSGQTDSKARRQALKRRLGLPEHLSSNGLLEAIGLLYDREEFLALMAQGDWL